jgi:hypothetical protein
VKTLRNPVIAGIMCLDDWLTQGPTYLLRSITEMLTRTSNDTWTQALTSDQTMQEIKKNEGEYSHKNCFE